jgi:hypothetical protein
MQPCKQSQQSAISNQQPAISNQQSAIRRANPGALGRGRSTLTHLPIRTSSLLPAPSTGHACEMMEREMGKKRRWALRCRLPDSQIAVRLPRLRLPRLHPQQARCSSWVVICVYYSTNLLHGRHSQLSGSLALWHIGCQCWLGLLISIPSSVSCSSRILNPAAPTNYAFPTSTADDPPESVFGGPIRPSSPALRRSSG